MLTSYKRTIPSATFGRDREQHRAEFAARLASEVDRVSWTYERLCAFQTDRLRTLLASAREHSEWHRERLHGIDIDRVTAAEIAELPPMTKQDLLENWDRISCDPRLTLAAANEHLERAAQTGLPEYFHGERGQYLIFASGGSSGVRTVMAYDFEGWLAVHLATARVPIAGDIRAGALDASRYLRTVGLFSASAANVHGVAPHCFTPEDEDVFYFDPSTPIEELVAALNAIQPEAIHGFPSMMHVLAIEQIAGRLSIEPLHFMVSGEPLLPEARAAADLAFGAQVYDFWAATETGPMALTDGVNDDVLSLAEDNALVEVLDHGVYATNLVSSVLPLIRYELNDAVGASDLSSDLWPAGRKIERVAGRIDEAFRYPNGVYVHAGLFRTVMSTVGSVSEYQVRQTPNGAEILVRTTSDEAELAGVEGMLTTALEAAGLSRPAVSVTGVSALERHERSGKFKRFVPLG